MKKLGVRGQGLGNDDRAAAPCAVRFIGKLGPTAKVASIIFVEIRIMPRMHAIAEPTLPNGAVLAAPCLMTVPLPKRGSGILMSPFGGEVLAWLAFVAENTPYGGRRLTEFR